MQCKTTNFSKAPGFGHYESSTRGPCGHSRPRLCKISSLPPFTLWDPLGTARDRSGRLGTARDGSGRLGTLGTARDGSGRLGRLGTLAQAMSPGDIQRQWARWLVMVYNHSGPDQGHGPQVDYS